MTNSISVTLDGVAWQTPDGRSLFYNESFNATCRFDVQPDGSLANPENSDRWVRDAQYLRLHLGLNDSEQVLAALPSGARATVQLYPVSGPARWLGQVQARFISLLHYIY